MKKQASRLLIRVRDGASFFDIIHKTTTAGATIAFGATEGVAASLFVDDDIDLTKFSFRPADDASKPAMSGYAPLLTVPWDCEFTGEPTLSDPTARFRAVTNRDGSKTLAVHARQGVLILVK